jgi:hypothetical protein
MPNQQRLGSHLSFDVPFALKGNAQHAVDGHDLVYCGKVKLEGDVLSIYEAGDHSDGTNGSAAALTFRITLLDSVKARRYKSAGGRFCGGRIVFVGSFGRPFKEKVVFKMEIGEYQRMTTALGEIKASLPP